MLGRFGPPRELPSAPSIFGHKDRTAMLRYIARYGPCFGREAARALGIEQAHAARVAADFMRMGIVMREPGPPNKSRLLLDESFLPFLSL